MTQGVNKKCCITFVLSLTALVIFGGCSSEHQDIQQWMSQQRQAATAHVPPIAKPVPFMPVAYTQPATSDPFEANRLINIFKDQDAGKDALCQAELNRRREPLEALPLNAMTMVGSLEQHGQQVALIKANDLLYQIRIGNHLGQDFGKVINITESAIDLREIIRNPMGECSEHNTTMQLQQSQEKSR